MKKILTEAINGIDWDTPESINYVLHSKGNKDSFFVENILLYLNQISKLKFYSNKLIDGVRKQKVDLIEGHSEAKSKHFIIEGESKNQIPVARLVDLGLCAISQPADYNINKTLSDIKKRTHTQKMTNDYYTIQLVIDANKPKTLKREQVVGVAEKTKEEKFKVIDNDYQKLDAEYIKLPFHLSEGLNNVDLCFYICGPFNKNSWQTIVKTFADYKTSKSKSLAVFNA